MDQQIQEAFVALAILRNCELAEAMGLTPAELDCALKVSAAQFREGELMRRLPTAIRTFPSSVPWQWIFGQEAAVERLSPHSALRFSYSDDERSRRHG